MTSITAPLTEEMFAAASAIPRWPPRASNDYIKARNELLKEEYELRAQIERIAAKRRALPQGAIMQDYVFDEGPLDLSKDGPTKKTTLADLAADGRSLVICHFMFDPSDEEPCPMCSMGLDSYNATIPHVSQNINFAVVGKGPLPKLRAWAKKRGWHNLRFLSSLENTFNKDMNVEDAEWMKFSKQAPGVSVFKKDGESGEVRHMYTAFPAIEPGSERGLDLMNGTYNILDLTPEGRGNWYAENEYD